jgi:hypothetical protein
MVMRELEYMWKCIKKKLYMQLAIVHTIFMLPASILYFFFYTKHTLLFDVFIWSNVILIIYWITAFVNVYFAIRRYLYIDLLSNSYTNGKKLYK